MNRLQEQKLRVYIRNEAKKILKEESSELNPELKKVKVGNNVITVNPYNGNIMLYDEKVSRIINIFTPSELALLMKISKRKSVDE